MTTFEILGEQFTIERSGVNLHYLKRALERDARSAVVALIDHIHGSVTEPARFAEFLMANAQQIEPAELVRAFVASIQPGETDVQQTA